MPELDMAVSDRSIARSCASKARFWTQERAELVARIKAAENNRPMRVYYCMICGGWHITSKPEDRDVAPIVIRK